MGSGVHPTFIRSSGYGASVPPVEEVRQVIVPEAAFDSVQGVGARVRPAVSRPFEGTLDEVLAGALHAAGSDWQSALATEVVAQALLVGLETVDAGRDGFGAAAVRLQLSDDLIDPPGDQPVLDPVYPCRFTPLETPKSGGTRETGTILTKNMGFTRRYRILAYRRRGWNVNCSCT